MLEKYISSYQDEVGKENANKKRGREPAYEGKHDPTGKKKANTKNWKNPKTHVTGVLWAGGFFENKRSPGNKQPRNQKAWVRDFVHDWSLLLRKMNKRKNDGNRLTLTLSKQTVQDMNVCGVPADILAQEILQDGMDIYAKRHGWKRKDLGWLAGFHHDKDHLHLHVLIFPTTKQGVPLKLSNGNEKDGEISNDLTDLTGAVNVAAEMFYQRYLPYKVQTAEVKLAWWKGTNDAPVPRIEDYRVENPAPMKYMVPEERAEIRRLRQEATNREKRAELSLEIERTKNPGRQQELEEEPTPVQTEGNDRILQQLLRHYLWTDTLNKQRSALEEDERLQVEQGKIAKGGLHPESPDPEVAQRAVEILSYSLPAANTHLAKLEEQIEATIDVINNQMEENRQRRLNQSGIIQNTVNLAINTWNNSRLGLTKWRLGKIKEVIQEPGVRGRILGNLTLAHSQMLEGSHLTEMEQGLETLKNHAREQAMVYQRRAEKIMKGADSEAGAGKRLLERLMWWNKSIPKAKKEIAWMNSLKGILTKAQNPGKPSKEVDLLLIGGKLRLQTIQDQKEYYRSMIRMRGGKKKTPVPARIKIRKDTEDVTPESGTRAPAKEAVPFTNLRLPRFLDQSRIGMAIEAKLEEINLRKVAPPENLTGETPSAEPNNDPLQKWKKLGDKGGLQSILQEFQRRKTKDIPKQ